MMRGLSCGSGAHACSSAEAAWLRRRDIHVACHRVCMKCNGRLCRTQPSIIFVDEVDALLGQRHASEQDFITAYKTEFMQHWEVRRGGGRGGGGHWEAVGGGKFEQDRLLHFTLTLPQSILDSVCHASFPCGCSSVSQHGSPSRPFSRLSLQGMTTSRDTRVVVLAATNRPDHLDEAVKRRFPDRFYIGKPDERGRIEILYKTLVRDGSWCGEVLEDRGVMSWKRCFSSAHTLTRCGTPETRSHASPTAPLV